MATFIATLTFTAQGRAALHDTCKRAAAFKAAARKLGAKVISSYWTLGEFDGVLIFEAPDEETAMTLMMHVGVQGFVHTKTVRAFTAAEMEKILEASAG
jgi:uncharacterized protein with GYD domain